MKTIKSVLASFFALILLAPSLPALELAAMRAADVTALPAIEVSSARAISDALLETDGLDPVVITIPGLSFAEIGPERLELKYLLKIINFFFPHKRITERDLAPHLDAANREYFMLEDGEPVPDLKSQRVPDNYIEEKLKELPGYANHDLVIIPFKWSRDPDDSETVIPYLAEQIARVHDQYRNSGRPIFILAHSWGTMLSHSALHRLARTRPEVKIKRWITMGSPLMPGNLVVDLFVKVGIKKEQLEKSVSKPASVAQWRNIWAKRDMLSNEVSPADSNTQVDVSVAPLEPQLIDLILHNKPLKKDAKKDLLKVRSIGDWHGSYFYDYRATLKSLQRDIYVPVFGPVLAPQVTGADK
jgi:pimeloyl-ACP methyl ester carboxylesterase